VQDLAKDPPPINYLLYPAYACKPFQSQVHKRAIFFMNRQIKAATRSCLVSDGDPVVVLVAPRSIFFLHCLGLSLLECHSR
jgi:hypothetical protein